MDKNFAEKVTIKAGGAFRNFPRFAYAHCRWRFYKCIADFTVSSHKATSPSLRDITISLHEKS